MELFVSENASTLFKLKRKKLLRCNKEKVVDA